MSCLPVLSIIEYPNGMSRKRDWHMYIMFDYSKNKYFVTGNRLNDKHCYNFYFDCTRGLAKFIQYSMDINNKYISLTYEMYGLDTDNHYDFLNYNFYDFNYFFDKKYELFAYDNEKHNCKTLEKFLHMLECSSFDLKKDDGYEFNYQYEPSESAYDYSYDGKMRHTSAHYDSEGVLRF